ncbi:MAG: hypothetical protein JSR77_10065 [Planctomycetes bacterium]|nr:hypothetical protein [Planctomycetota bacterium]
MKLKGIKPLEQHIDKIVIAAAAVAGAGLLVYQFVRPNEVEVDKVKRPPAQAFDPVKDAAKALDSKLNAAVLPDSLAAPAISVADRLVLDVKAVPAPKVALGPAPGIGKTQGTGPVAAATFKLPAVPAPTLAARHAFRSTISPVEVVRHPELAKSGLIPAAQPFDKAAVSIEGVFNGQSLRDVLLADPDGPGPMEAVPLSWWRDAANEANDLLEIVSVQVERETLRNPDGTTPSSPTVTIVPVLPGNTDTMALWNTNVKSIGDVPPYIEQLRNMSEEIQRPRYFSTIAGPDWKAPSLADVAGDSVEKTRAVDRAKKQLKDANDKIADIKTKLENIPNVPGGPTVRPPTPPRDGGGPGPGKGGGGGGPQRTPQPPKEDPAANRKQLEMQLKNLTERRNGVVKQLQELGEKVEVDADDKSRASNAATPVLPLLENTDVKLFAHDFTTQAGSQYRYRMRVVINNPLFGRSLQESQKALGESRLIEGAWSEWSQPVDVDPDAYYFITSADRGGGDLSPNPHAVASMYFFYYGYYRAATVGLDPGDPIAGVAKLPELKFADLKKIEEAMKDPNAAPGGPAAPPPPPMPNPRGPGGKMPQGPRDQTQGEDRPMRGPGGMQPALPPLPEWLNVPVPRDYPLNVSATFLDSTPIPVDAAGLAGENRQRFQAILRDAFGRIIVRQPDMDRSSDAYKRLEASAHAGETQGAPRINPEDTRPKIPLKRDTGPKGPPNSGGGGGGGGG